MISVKFHLLGTKMLMQSCIKLVCDFPWFINARNVAKWVSDFYCSNWCQSSKKSLEAYKEFQPWTLGLIRSCMVISLERSVGISLYPLHLMVRNKDFSKIFQKIFPLRTIEYPKKSQVLLFFFMCTSKKKGFSGHSVRFIENNLEPL